MTHLPIGDMSDTHVSLLKCDTYDQSQVDISVERALDLLGGMGRWVQPGARVLLKVNLLAGTPPEKAVTTHPSVVRAVIRQVLACGGRPTVGDCGGSEGPASLKRFVTHMRSAGIAQVCEEEGVALEHLSAEPVEIVNDRAKYFKRFPVGRAVVDADVLINLPKLKTHGLCLFTGGVKNLFGCIPGLHKVEMHGRAQGPERFSQLVVDLLGAVRPTLTVLDGIVGMEGDGPQHGRPRDIGAILAATDPVALDAVACHLVGIEPLSVPTTRLAHEQGVGQGDLSHIRVLGESPESMLVDDFQLPTGATAFLRSTHLLSFLRDRTAARPVILSARCESCWMCVKHCPVEAVTADAVARTALIDNKTCIRCYCCHEMCPHNAIELREPFLARFIN